MDLVEAVVICNQVKEDLELWNSELRAYWERPNGYQYDSYFDNVEIYIMKYDIFHQKLSNLPSWKCNQHIVDKNVYAKVITNQMYVCLPSDNTIYLDGFNDVVKNGIAQFLMYAKSYYLEKGADIFCETFGLYYIGYICNEKNYLQKREALIHQMILKI